LVGTSLGAKSFCQAASGAKASTGKFAWDDRDEELARA
jgi:hypothetical protein